MRMIIQKGRERLYSISEQTNQVPVTEIPNPSNIIQILC